MTRMLVTGFGPGPCAMNVVVDLPRVFVHPYVRVMTVNTILLFVTAMVDAGLAVKAMDCVIAAVTIF